MILHFLEMTKNKVWGLSHGIFFTMFLLCFDLLYAICELFSVNFMENKIFYPTSTKWTFKSVVLRILRTTLGLKRHVFDDQYLKNLVTLMDDVSRRIICGRRRRLIYYSLCTESPELNWSDKGYFRCFEESNEMNLSSGRTRIPIWSVFLSGKGTSSERASRDKFTSSID